MATTKRKKKPSSWAIEIPVANILSEGKTLHLDIPSNPRVAYDLTEKDLCRVRDRGLLEYKLFNQHYELVKVLGRIEGLPEVFTLTSAYPGTLERIYGIREAAKAVSEALWNMHIFNHLIEIPNLH